MNIVFKYYKINNYMYIINRLNNIKKTPLIYSERLSKIYNCNIYLKREDLQTTRSFKIRGAFNKIYKNLYIYNKIINSDFYMNNGLSKKVITVSAGNHAQGVGYVCDMFNLKCDVYIPKNTPQQKINAIEKYKSVNIIKHGNSFDESYNKCIYNNKLNKKKINNDSDIIFIHPFNDHDVIEGQGNIMKEIYEEIIPDYVVSSIGGGGLMAGLINYNNYFNNINNCFKNHILPNYFISKVNTKFIGVEPYNASSMYNSIKNNKIIINDDICTFVDGASVKKVGDIPFNIIKNNIDEIIRIYNDELCYDLIDLYQNDGIITELAGTLPISALRHLNKDKIKGKNIVCIISGGNNDINRIDDFINKKNNYLINL
jgi:threonine dehydratase